MTFNTSTAFHTDEGTVNFKSSLLGDQISHMQKNNSMLSLVPQNFIKGFNFNVSFIVRYERVENAAAYFIQVINLMGLGPKYNRQKGADWPDQIRKEFHRQMFVFLDLADAGFGSVQWHTAAVMYQQMRFVPGLHHFRDIISNAQLAPVMGDNFILNLRIAKANEKINYVATYVGENKAFLQPLYDASSKLPVPHFDVMGQGLLESIKADLKGINFPFERIPDFNAVNKPAALAESFNWFGPDGKFFYFFAIFCSGLDISALAYNFLYGIHLTNTFGSPVVPFVPGDEIDLASPTQDINYRFAVSRLFAQYNVDRTSFYHMNNTSNFIFVGFMYKNILPQGFLSNGNYPANKPSFTPPETPSGPRSSGNMSMNAYSGKIEKIGGDINKINDNTKNISSKLKSTINNVSKVVLPALKIYSLTANNSKINKSVKQLTDTVSQLNEIDVTMKSVTNQIGLVNASLNIFKSDISTSS